MKSAYPCKTQVWKQQITGVVLSVRYHAVINLIHNIFKTINLSTLFSA